MEEPSTTLEVSKDLSAEIKSCEEDGSFGSSIRDSSSVSMPFCFLVKEHSKSVVQIQELEKRLLRVENVQDDVIDAIIEFRNYLSDSKSYNSSNPLAVTNSLGVSHSPPTPISKLTPSRSNTDVPCVIDVPQSIVKNKSYSSKDCDPIFSEFAKNQTVAILSQKHFDLAKSKDSSTLESDKQDSGLDSDCREHHEINPSLNRNASSLATAESNDELLQLLDEVGHRSTILQNQLAVTESMTSVEKEDPTTKQESPNAHNLTEHKSTELKLPVLEVSKRELLQNKVMKSKSFAAPPSNQSIQLEENALTQHDSHIGGLFEGKAVKNVGARTAFTGVDSSVVSSILKETNAVELQRQTLVLLVDNAVLHTKLLEAEETLSSRNVAGDKIENTLKEEARLLMMENRELRISLEEQKMENHALKSRLAMLERVAQSVTNENHELNIQLGESLNLPRKGLLNFSSSSSARTKKSSLPETNIQCVKSKLLSNNSSFLDVTVENSNELVAPAGSAAIKYQKFGPMHSSTPMVPLQKFRSSLNSSSNPGEASPANFHSVKKCLMKPNSSGNFPRRSSLVEEDSYDIPGVKHFREGASSQDGVSKFPFNSILEKLKSNSEYRFSKSASTKSEEATAKLQISRDSLKNESTHQGKDTQVNASEIVLQRKKGRNIQQRIQNILDRIVAESEDVS